MAWATAAMLAISGIGTAVSVRNQLKAGEKETEAGKHAREAAESQAELADYNAKVAELQAQDAVARGAIEENKFRQGVKLMIGSQRAGIAAGNIDVGFGSAVDVQADAAFLGEVDALQIRTNAAREAWGYKVQAADLHKRAEIARKEGVYLEAAGAERGSAAKWGAIGTIAGTGASLLMQRYGYRPSGGFESRDIGSG